MKRSILFAPMLRAAALGAAVVLVAACHRGAVGPDKLKPANVLSHFDVTLIAAKDNQFDYDPDGGTNGAPLTAEDLRGALRYRLEQHLPMSTVLLKRGEKQKIKQDHMIMLARIAYEMKFKAFMLDDDGTIFQLVPSGHLAGKIDAEKSE